MLLSETVCKFFGQQSWRAPLPMACSLATVPMQYNDIPRLVVLAKNNVNLLMLHTVAT